MNTPHKTEMKKRHEKDNKNFEIWIENEENVNGLRVVVDSQFKSIDEALHKIELDLMTYLHYGFQYPIKIKIVEVKKWN